jgi:DNA-directed RNA polymerase subunit beta
MVNELIHNYKIKLNDLQALRREKFTFLLGMNSAGILKLAKVYCKKRKLKVG